jgi:hypothetical protein
MSEDKRLTVDDPVDEATLSSLAKLREVRLAIGAQLIDTEMQKIQLLGSVKKIDEQNQRLFDAILTERGLPIGTVIELDGQTGKLKVLSSEGT